MNKAAVVGSRQYRATPTAPTAMKGRFETTFQKFGIPTNARASANA